ncbi:MAG: ABC transporter ATP-binding protein/permease [bacterium]|nr:ABC transporter ATP-binding protein/permease [bacterium]
MKNIKYLYSYIFRYKYTATCFYLTLIIFSILENLSPYFYKLFIDTASLEKYDELFMLFIFFLGLRASELIFEQICRILWDKIIFNAGRNARIDIFTKIHELDFSYHLNKSTGSLISASKRGDGAFYDLSEILNFDLIRILISFTVMIIFLGSIQTEIALVVVLTIITNCFAGYFLIRHNISKRKAWTDEEDRISEIITDNLINFDTVKLFAKENWEREKLKKAFIPWMKKLWEFSFSFRWMEITSGIIGNVSIAFAVGIALFQVSIKSISPGEFILVVGFLTTLYPKLTQIIFRVRNIAKHYTDIDKYFNILDQKITVKDPKKPLNFINIKGKIEFNNVTFNYPENTQSVLKDFSLKIKQGQSVALVGRSGMGKTTIVKLLMRFYDIQKGEIKIDDINIKKVTKTNLRSIMGIVPQEPILFNDTIAYNIGYGKEDVTFPEIKAAAKMAFLDEFIESLPAKYETKVGERGIKLSGGQKQRLAIARVILANPHIIIFDEATSHLDSESEGMIQEAFWKAAKDKTTIVIAHRLATIVKADNIIVMDDGKIIEEGSHRALIQKKNGQYKYFWDLQTNIE